MKINLKIYFLFAITLLSTICVAAQTNLSKNPQAVVAFVKVNVIPMDREHILFNQTVRRAFR